MLKHTASAAYLNCQRAPKTNYELLLENKPEWELRFWPKVNKTDGCWYWTAAKNNSGYGVFAAYNLGPKRKKFEYAHRVSFILFKGEIAEGHVVDHKCGNSACVNPSHLQSITHNENCRQGAKKNRSMTCKTCGTIKERVYYPSSKNPRTVCRPCTRAANRKYQRKQRYGAGVV